MGWKGWLLAAPVILAMVVVLAWLAWLWAATRQQNAAIARLHAAGLPSTFEAHLKDLQPLDDADNAAVDFLAAIELMDTQAPAWTAFQEWRIPETEMTAEERAQWLKLQSDVAAEQASAIQRVEPVDAKIRPAVAAVQADFGAWSALKAEIAAGRIPANPIEVQIPHLVRVRQLSSVLAAGCRTAAAAGDARRALEHVIRIAGLADAVDSDSTILVEHLVAISIRVRAANLAIEIADSAASDVQARGLRIAAARLLVEEEPLRAGYARSIRGETAFEMEIVRALNEGRMTFAGIGGDEPTAPDSFVTALSAPILRGDAAMMANHLTTWYTAIDAPSLPDAAARLPDRSEVDESPLLNLYVWVLQPSFERFVEAEYRQRTELHLAAAALAIAAYRDDNGGRWPESLDELVPAWLPAPPRDAMAAGAPPLRYDPARKLLWSVGTDGQDDGGDATSTRANEQKSSRWDGRDAVVELERAE